MGGLSGEHLRGKHEISASPTETQSGELNLGLWRGWEPQAGTEGLWSLEKHRLWSLEGTLPGWLCVGESGEQQGLKVGALTNRDCAKFRPKP